MARKPSAARQPCACGDPCDPHPSDGLQRDNGTEGNGITTRTPGNYDAAKRMVRLWRRAGSGIACWLEILQGLARSPLRCPVLFVSSSGHELGHLGIDAFIARRSGIVKRARAWLNLGANIGAVTVSTDVRLQASDDELDTVITDALMVEGIVVAQRASQNAIPSGEVESVRRAGGRCATVMCGNLLFHNVKDCGLKVTSPEAVERFSRAFITVTRSLARTS